MNKLPACPMLLNGLFLSCVAKGAEGREHSSRARVLQTLRIGTSWC